MAIILLKDSLTTKKARRKLSLVSSNSKVVTDELKMLIVRHKTDIYIYSKRSFFNICSFFKGIMHFVSAINYFHIGTEWDVE